MPSREVTRRVICRACESRKLLKILSLGKQYLSDFTSNSEKPPKFSLELVLCTMCNLVQLRHTVSSSLLYTERYGYKSGINKTMQDELKEIVNKAQNKFKKRVSTVMDIGANDGTLLLNYPRDIFKIAVEPIKKFAKECEEIADVVINHFFSYESFSSKIKNKKADIITAISCFYDMDDPNKFLLDVKKVLHQDGILIIQQNYLVSMLDQNAFDNIVHEHLEYYSLLSLENLLKRHNLEVFDVELTKVNGGSFRTYIAIKGKRQIKESVLKLREKEKTLELQQKRVYKQFAKRVIKNKEKLRNLIEELVKKNKTIYAYGASTRGNTLLQYYKLSSKLIKKAVERYPEKWGKRIASVDVPIISEDQARNERPDYMLVLPWFFRDEFLKREKKYLVGGGHFIFPLPYPEII